MWIFFILLAIGGLNSSVSQADPETIVLPGDEFILPPYLRAFQGDNVLNVTAHSNRKRAAKQGEFLEYGDSFDLPGRLAMWVVARETIQWTGGGVFQAKLGELELKNKVGTPYDITLERGWMKVWTRLDPRRTPIKISTTEGSFSAEQAIFWINARTDLTELYLVSGEVKDAGGRVLKGKMFYSWDHSTSGIKSYSKDWDPEAWSVQLAGLYPDFVKLSDKAHEGWRDGTSETIYANLRKNGWRKGTRFGVPTEPVEPSKPKPTPHPRTPRIEK